MHRLILAILLLLATPAFAEKDGALQRLLSLDEARPWGAVGRVNVAGRAFCTGALIAPDLVLTAAHCLFVGSSDRMVKPGEVHFLAGFRKGTFVAHRRVKRFRIHRDYDRSDPRPDRLLTADLAVLELDLPVAASEAQPFERARRPRTGDPVTLVSYARERSEVPSIQEPCHVLVRRGRVMLLSCDVNYGASGAPVFVRDGTRSKVAALISAMTEWEDRKVAVAIELDPVLDEVLGDLATAVPERRTVRPGDPVAAVPPPVRPDPALTGRKISTPPP